MLRNIDNNEIVSWRLKQHIFMFIRCKFFIFHFFKGLVIGEMVDVKKQHTIHAWKVVGIGRSRCLLLKRFEIMLRRRSLACNVPLWNVEFGGIGNARLFVFYSLSTEFIQPTDRCFTAQLFDRSLFFATLLSSPFNKYVLLKFDVINL